MHKRIDAETFLREKFLRGPDGSYFVFDSFRFRLELVSNREGRFLAKDLEFIFQDPELIREFQDWEAKKYLVCMTSFMQQARVLIYSQ